MNANQSFPTPDTVIFGLLHRHATVSALTEDRHDWVLAALRECDEVLSDPAFPCLFGRRAWRDKSAQMLFCADLGKGGTEHFRVGVLEYTEFVKSTPVGDRLFSPLIVFVDGLLGKQHDAHHHTAWQLLQGLLDADPAPWPGSTPTNPNNSLWSFCFNGVQLFFNISTPAHTKLRSRCLGSYLTFVVNPRENFDVVASSQDKSGQLIRQKIRDRVSTCNSGLVPSELGFFGDRDNFEWKQFQLGEPDMPGPTICPLKLNEKKATLSS